jgi:class 3 adenylate cyclase
LKATVEASAPAIRSKEAAVECRNCRRQHNANAAFCDSCGTPLEAVCSSCGEPLRAGARFCAACGQPRAGAPEAGLSRYAAADKPPGLIIEEILTASAVVPGERKEVSVLFSDIKGSMELIAERDPEQAQMILDPVLELMIGAVHRYEGTVCQVMGDGIMALFGAPVAQEDHAVRACHAALDLQETIERYAVNIRAQHGIDVQVRVGLNSGEVVVRGIRTDIRLEYTAVGQTAHLAARMEQLARPGTILISESTLSAAKGLVDVNPLGPVPVKGLKDSVQIYELLAARQMQNPLKLASAVHGGLSGFVGRNAELGVLSRVLNRAYAGHGQIAALVGEPGIGKSRLAYEIQRSHEARGWITLEGHAVSYAGRTAYLPVVAMLKAYLGVDASDSVRDIRRKVEEGVAAVESDIADIVSAIIWLFDIAAENPEAAQWADLDAAARRQRTIDAIKRFILRLSNIHPLIVLFEDLQWVDDESHAILDALVEVLPTARILLLVTYRREYEHRWVLRTFYTQIRVDPLTRTTAEAFLAELLGSDASLDSLKNRLIEHTEGNPFFLEESVRSLADAHALAGPARGL